MNPLVSICVPVYNVSAFIERCAKSLFTQSYDNIQYIFVDDCGTDNSIDILEDIVQSLPEDRKKDVHIAHHEHNRGVAAARNTALALVRGDFVIWVDPDDYVDHNYVESLLEEYNSSKADIIICPFMYENKDRQKKNKPIKQTSSKLLTLDLLRGKSNVSVWGKLYKSELFLKNNIHFTEGLNCGEDFCVQPQIVYFSSAISYIDNAFYHYDCSVVSSLTHSISENTLNNHHEAYLSLLEFFENKGGEFVNSLNEGVVKMYSQDLVKCCRYNNNRCFNIIRKYLKELPSGSFSALPIPYRIITLISNYHLAKCYVQSIDRIRKIFR